MKFINVYLEKFSQLSLRERLLVLLVSAVVLYFLFDALLLTPQQKRIQQLTQATQAHRVEDSTLTAQLVVLDADKTKGAALMQRQREELAALQQQIAAAERFYGQDGQHKSGLAVLLRELLAANPNVSLAGLKTQPTTVFFSPVEQIKNANASQAKGNPAGSPAPEFKNVVYRSGVDVSLQGSYTDLLAYLRALEQRSSQLFWSTARLDVKAYPQSELKLDIATLGVDASTPLN